MRTLLILLSSLLCLPTAVARESEYPRGQLLVEPAQLKQPLAGEQFVILDARPKEEYEKSHIPGALWVDAALWKKEFDAGSDASKWSERLGELGLTPRTTVVLYDDNSAKDAARIWWILRFWGLEDARLLNGGWSGWKAANGPTQQEIPDAPQAVEFQVNPQGQRLATKQSLLDAIAEQSMQIIDARSEPEFCGLDPRNNQRGGSIPGAKNLEWSELIDQQTGRFKSAEELQKLFDEAGIDLDEPAAAHCQSGGRSSVMAFAMELMGAKPVKNYYAGWNEWGNTEETPIVKPKPKKE